MTSKWCSNCQQIVTTNTVPKFCCWCGKDLRTEPILPEFKTWEEREKNYCRNAKTCTTEIILERNSYMTRVLEIGTRKYTEVIEFEKCKSGAGCLYEIGTVPADGSREVFASIRFQNGPIKENGVNGCHNEDLIAIVIDRLQGFQSGQFSCRENAIAITKLEEALMWLNKRTADRVARGVEGTNEV